MYILNLYSLIIIFWFLCFVCEIVISILNLITNTIAFPQILRLYTYTYICMYLQYFVMELIANVENEVYK